MTSLGDGLDFDALRKALRAPEDVIQLRAEVVAATRRAQKAEAKIAAVLALIADPEQSHRMLTRTELGRLLR